MDDNGEAMMTEIAGGVDNLQQLLQEDRNGNLTSSELVMVFTQLPELLAQAKHQLNSPSSGHSLATTTTTPSYISCIKINGTPILPPVLDENSKKEMRMYRDEAIRRSKEREKQKIRRSSTSDLSIPASSPARNTSKTDGHDLYDSLDSSQQENVLAQALASAISPNNHSTKSDQQVIATRTPADNSSAVYWKHTDIVLNSFSDFGSLDDGSLPTQLHGIPLTSVSEQQITRDLSTLSKHLPESCSPAASELCDLSLDLNSKLPAISPVINVPTIKYSFTGSPPPPYLSSTSSPTGEHNSNHNPAVNSENATDPAPIFKAPIFLTEDNGLHLSVKKASPTSVASSPSLKESPVVSEKPWIMNSPLIAYVTKKRPKPVGMCSLQVKPDTLTKSQRVNNATFTILKEQQSKQNDNDQDNDDTPQLKRPVIKEQRSSTPNPDLSNNNSLDPPRNNPSPIELSSPSSRKKQTGCRPDSFKSSACQKLPVSQKSSESGSIDVQTFKFPGSAHMNNSKLFNKMSSEQNGNNNNSTEMTDQPKVNLNDAISSASSSLSASTCELYPKEHLGEDSLDELLLGVENIGLVPRIDGDGSDVPSPSSLSKDPANLSLLCLSDLKGCKQAWPKNVSVPSPEFVRANFSPVGTDSPHHLQVSIATVDVTTSSGIASLCDISADSPVTCLSNHPKISSSIATDSDTNFTNGGIRRGSYTLLEPSINLTKLAQLTPSPARDNHNRSTISDKIPSYADFETALQSPKPVKPHTATPSRLVTPVKHTTAKLFSSDSKCVAQKKPRKSMSPSVSKAKSANQIKKVKDSFHLTPQFPKSKNSPRCFRSERSKKHEKLTAIPQPITVKKNSPKSFREWRLSNIDNKMNADAPKKDVRNTKLRDEPFPNVSVDSPVSALPSPPLSSPALPSPSLPSPSPTIDHAFDWDNKIEDQMKCFITEDKHSYVNFKMGFNDCQEEMDVEEKDFFKTLETISRSKHVSENCRRPVGLDYLSPDISFTSTEHGKIETPVKQLFVPQTQVSMSVSSQALSEFPDEVVKPAKSKIDIYERIPALAKGYLLRKLLACPKVVTLRTTIQECRNLLEEMEYNSNDEFISRIQNQLESSRQEIHAIFFDWTAGEKMSLISQSREMINKKPIKVKVHPSNATQKYRMRKKAEKPPVPNKKVASLKEPVVCTSSSKTAKQEISKKETAQSKPDNRSVRKVAPSPNVPKKQPCKVVSVPGKMTTTRIVATKVNAGPLRNNSYKPWR